MVGILIVAHGTFGEALIHCASHRLAEVLAKARSSGIEGVARLGKERMDAAA